jgi:hypothetical protein
LGLWSVFNKGWSTALQIRGPFAAPRSATRGSLRHAYGSNEGINRWMDMDLSTDIDSEHGTSDQSSTVHNIQDKRYCSHELWIGSPPDAWLFPSIQAHWKLLPSFQALLPGKPWSPSLRRDPASPDFKICRSYLEKFETNTPLSLKRGLNILSNV